MQEQAVPPEERKPFELHWKTKVLLNIVQHMEKGQLIPYKELNEAVSGDVQTADHCYLYKARERARKQDRVATVMVENKGMLRLDDAECLPESLRRVHVTRRASERGESFARAADYNKLSRKDRSDCLALTAIHGVLQTMAHPKSLARIRKEIPIPRAPDRVSSQKVVDMAKSTGKKKKK